MNRPLFRWLPVLLTVALYATEALAVPATDGSEQVSLATAVQRATSRHPSVLVALQEIRRAQGLLEEARAGSLPTLSGNVTYTRLENDRGIPPVTAPGGQVVTPGRTFAYADTVNANLLLAVPLLVPQRWAQWLHAADNVKVARISAEDAKRQVALATARTFLVTLAQHRTIEALEEARKTARAHLDFARKRRQGGLGNRLDVVRAEREVNTDESLVQAAYSALAKDQEALGVLSGDEHPLDAGEDPALAGPQPLFTALSGSQTGRVDIRALHERQEAARRVVRDNWVDYLPSLVATFQPFAQSRSTPIVPELGWQAQVILTIPIYDGGYRYGASKERWALYRQSQANLEGALRQARADVRASFEATRRADAALDAAREAAQPAGEALKLASLAYGAGLGTNLEVIDAERQARDSDTAVTVAEDAVRQSRLDLLIASGRFP